MHAWFVGYITNDNAPYAICVLVENGGSGGSVAAPLARKALQKAINQAVVSHMSAADAIKRKTNAKKRKERAAKDLRK